MARMDMLVSLLYVFFFFSSRRRHTRWTGDWSSDVCSSDLSSDGSQRVATETGDEDVANRDLGGDALATVRTRDINACHRGAAVADPGIDRLGAVEGGNLRPVAIVERPGAGGADRDRSG